jgi:hypothetical protein
MQTRPSLRLILGFLLISAPQLFALNNRSAVSVTGLDTNPCTTTSPCRSFNTAIAATSSGGEVIALDSAGYGAFTVTTPLAVSGAPGVHAALSVSTGAGITVSAGATDRVVVSNLVLIGAGGASGILDTGSKELTITGCLIRGFSIDGVQVDSTAGDLSMQRCTIIQNGGPGFLQNAGGSVHHIVISGCIMHYNYDGVDILGSGDAVIADSNISDNFNYGVLADATASACVVTLKRCSLTGNYDGVQVTTGQGIATVYLSQNVITFNVSGVRNMGTGITFGNNRIVFNAFADVFGSLTPQGLQ